MLEKKISPTNAGRWNGRTQAAPGVLHGSPGHLPESRPRPSRYSYDWDAERLYGSGISVARGKDRLWKKKKNRIRNELIYSLNFSTWFVSNGMQYVKRVHSTRRVELKLRRKPRNNVQASGLGNSLVSSTWSSSLTVTNGPFPLEDMLVSCAEKSLWRARSLKNVRDN